MCVSVDTSEVRLIATEVRPGRVSE
jgi:hypothetical protein